MSKSFFSAEHPVLLTLGFGVVCVLALVLVHTSPVDAAGKPCSKFSGTVVLTYTNPTTIILHIIKGKVNAATTFTMTTTTTYIRNGAPATFADIKIGDSGYITATEELPSGTLLTCTVVMNGK